MFEAICSYLAMKKNTSLLLFFFFGFFSGFAFAQNKAIDSLRVALNKTKNDIDKVQLLNTISMEYQSSDPKSVLEFGNKALQLSKKIKSRLAEGTSYLNIGNGHILMGNYPDALRSFSDAQAVFEKELESNSLDKRQEIKNGLARAYGSIGIVFSEQSNYTKALHYHLKAVKIYEESNDLSRCARVYNNIGIVYRAQGEDFKALDYYIRCLKIQEKIKDETIGITTTNIGNIYLDQKNFAKAFDYYAKAKQYFERFPNQVGLGELYNNLGLYYYKTGNSAEALAHYNKALAVFGGIDNKFGISDSYYHIGEVYMAQKKFEEALVATNRSLTLAKELDVMEQVKNTEQRLSEIYERLNRPAEALAHYKRFTVAKDSVSNYENIRNSIRAEMNFEFDKKEALQKKEREKRELIYNEQSKRHQQQIGFVILSLLLVVGIVFLFYNRLQLKKTLTLQKDLAEYEQKALHLQMNPHFVFNCLGSISSFIVQNGTDSAIKYLSKFSKLMRLTLEYSKESLIPIDKEIESLQNYLELEQLRFNKKFEFNIMKSSELEDDMALPPLLLQPFVENAIIHGLIPKKERGYIDIDFSIEDQGLVCRIIDNGIGFNKSKELKENLVSVHKSMALDITRKRLEMMEAITAKTSHVEIEERTAANGEIIGTIVILKLPIQYIK